LATQIKKIFKDNNLEIRSLFQLKYEFQRRDIYAFSFTNYQELKFFIESIGITTLPEDFVKCMFEAIVSPKSNKINYLLLK